MAIQLTEIELQFVRLLCEGLNNQEIAKKLFRSRWTINGYRESLLLKTKSKNSVQAIAKLFKQGIL